MPEALSQTIEKAVVLVEALPYLQRFRGSTVVVKYGGHAMIEDQIRRSVARDFILMENVGIHPVIVHGGGPEITNLMRRLGKEPQFHEGHRFTDAETLELTEMVLAGKLNGEIVARLNAAGGRAVGLSGKDGGLILARPRTDPQGRDLGFVGEVVQIRAGVLDLLIRNGFIPVIAPIGADAAGQGLNINADAVAAEVAVALKARKLVMMTDVRGILRDPQDESTLLTTIDAGQAPQLIAEGVISGGMIPKVKACLRALEGGAGKAHILDGRLPHGLLLELFTDEGIGTEIIR